MKGRSLVDAAKILLDRPYVYAEHYLPHDIDTREMTSAKTRKETLESMGLKPIRSGSKLPIHDGINAVRNLLPRCVFDAKKTAIGRKSLAHYHVDYDDKNQVNRKAPKHDWSSHDADAFRELAVQLYDIKSRRVQQQIAWGSDYDPLAPTIATPGEFMDPFTPGGIGTPHAAMTDWDPFQHD